MPGMLGCGFLAKNRAMADTDGFILGEFSRRLDDRFRLSIPSQLGDRLASESPDCILVKERSGCLSLWSAATWQTKWEARLELVQSKMRLGDLDKQMDNIQMFGRLLSTRQKPVQLAGRGRLLIPEGFREFLRVDAAGEVMVVGAAVCIEIWNPTAWLEYLEGRMPKFSRLFKHLSG